MGTLYIDRKELHIRLDGQALAFYIKGEREGLVPISPLKRVIVIGNVSIETPVLHKLSNENISVIFLSGKRIIAGLSKDLSLLRMSSGRSFL
jgi:CRISPR-associated protein Cas1